MHDILSYVTPPILQDTESMQEDLEKALVSPVLRGQVCLLLGKAGCDHVYGRAYSKVQDACLMTYVRSRCDAEGHAATVVVLTALLIEASQLIPEQRSADVFAKWVACDIADRGALKNVMDALTCRDAD